MRKLSHKRGYIYILVMRACMRARKNEVAGVNNKCILGQTIAYCEIQRGRANKMYWESLEAE